MHVPPLVPDPEDSLPFQDSGVHQDEPYQLGSHEPGHVRQRVRQRKYDA